jgi:hypothetical protein
LEFFAPAGQYFCIRERIQRDIANLLLLREPVNLGVVTGFYHHGKIRYLFPFKCMASNIDQLPVDTIFIWITVDSKSPEGTEPECWISSSPEKQEHQIPIAPFLEFAKYAPHELKPLLPPNLRANDNNEIPFVAAAAAAAEVINDMSAPVVVIDAAAATDPPPSPGTPLEEDMPYDASAAMDRLERICSEVALKIREPQQQQQRKSPTRHSSKSSSGADNDASGRKRGASSNSNGGRSSGSNKKERNPYLSPTSTVSSSSAASSRSSSVNRSSQKGGRSHGYFTSGGGGSGSGHNDRYKDQPDAKRSRQ